MNIKNIAKQTWDIYVPSSRSKKNAFPEMKVVRVRTCTKNINENGKMRQKRLRVFESDQQFDGSTYSNLAKNDDRKLNENEKDEEKRRESEMYSETLSSRVAN